MTGGGTQPGQRLRLTACADTVGLDQLDSLMTSGAVQPAEPHSPLKQVPHHDVNAELVGAEQPDQSPSTALQQRSSKAEAQPNARRSDDTIQSLSDCAEWLYSLPATELTPPLQRIQRAISILQMGRCREGRDKVQSILVDWDVATWRLGKKVHLPEAKAMLEQKVIRESSRLKRLHAQNQSASAISIFFQLSKVRS